MLFRSYEEWLASIAGGEIELSVNDTHIIWKNKDSNMWIDLVELEGLNGIDGEAGEPGKTPEFRVNAGYVEWKYKEETGWKQLYKLIEIEYITITFVTEYNEKADNTLEIVKSVETQMPYGAIKVPSDLANYNWYYYDKYEEKYLLWNFNKYYASNDVTLFAYSDYTITYLDENDDVYEVVKVRENNVTTKISYNPLEEEKSFIYWSEDGQNAFNFDIKINCNVTLKPILEETTDVVLSNDNEISNYAIQEEMGSFKFFWETQVLNGRGAGLIPDRYPSNGLASIASVGFGLAAFTVGVENGWITYQEGKERAIMTLEGMKTLERINGFYYHFYNENNGTSAPGSEVSVIDSAIFIIGALTAGEYFGGEVKTLAYDIYSDINWKWYVNPQTKQFYMSYNPTTKRHEGSWDVYGEQLMLYFLGAGSPVKEYRTGKDVYDSFRRYKGSYTSSKTNETYRFINSWFGSIFTYQFSHAFIDFRNIVDNYGIDWYQNSVIATKCARQYCIDNPEGFSTVTFNENSWGLTACDTPWGYSGFLGNNPTGNGGNDQTRNDGTVALCGSVGSMPFLPTEVEASIEYYYTFGDGKLVGKYGLLDSYNDNTGWGLWVANDVIGIDKGISVLMIENHRSGLIWDCLSKSSFMQQAIKELQFQVKN